MAKKIFLTLLCTFFLFANNAYAQSDDLPDPGMLPTSPMYFLKSWSESIGTFFTFGDLKKAERALELSEVRLAELDALVQAGEEEKLDDLLERYEKHIEFALEKAEKAKGEGLDTDEVLEKVAQATIKHQVVLGEVYERVPEQAKMSIQMAMEQSMQGQTQALEGISEQSRERVMNEIHERVMQNDETFERLREKGVNLPEDLEFKRVEEKVRNLERIVQQPEGEGNGVNVDEQIQQVQEQLEGNTGEMFEQVQDRLNDIKQQNMFGR